MSGISGDTLVAAFNAYQSRVARDEHRRALERRIRQQRQSLKAMHQAYEVVRHENNHFLDRLIELEQENHDLRSSRTAWIIAWGVMAVVYLVTTAMRSGVL